MQHAVGIDRCRCVPGVLLYMFKSHLDAIEKTRKQEADNWGNSSACPKIYGTAFVWDKQPLYAAPLTFFQRKRRFRNQIFAVSPEMREVAYQVDVLV